MNVKLVWGGWCQEGTSDKVWGVIQRRDSDGQTKLGDKVYVFWGARGRTMKFKNDIWSWELESITRKKHRKGYFQISYSKLLAIWPNFEETLNQRLTFHILSTMD